MANMFQVKEYIFEQGQLPPLLLATKYIQIL